MEASAAMKVALKPSVAEGGPAVLGGGNRRDWFLGVGGRGATFIAAGIPPRSSAKNQKKGRRNRRPLKNALGSDP